MGVSLRLEGRKEVPMRPRLIAALVPPAFLLALLVTAIPVAAGGGFCHYAATDGQGTTVEMSQICFTPTILHVQPGDTVTFVNRDKIEHVLSAANGGWALSNRLGEGQSFSYRFSSPGIFPYTCYLHPGMSGAVVVGDGRAVASRTSGTQTAAAGSPTGQPVRWPALSLLLIPLAGAAGYSIARIRRV